MRVFFIIGLCTLSLFSAAQDSLGLEVDSLIISSDSSELALDSTDALIEADTLKTASGPLLLSGLNWDRRSKAAFLSTILPGAGQIYNKELIKAPIYPGGMIAFSLSAVGTRSRYDNMKQSLLYKVGSTEVMTDPFPDLSKAEVRQRMDRNRRLSNWAVAGAGFSYASGIIDAYVSAHIDKREAELETDHIPVKAAYYSAMLPGCGQIYNQKWWKVPIIYAGFAGISAWGIYSYQNMASYRDAYLARNRYGMEDEYSDGLGTEYSDIQLIVLKNEHRKNLERSILFGTAWYTLNIIDAVVDAHLHNFEISDDLSIQPFPYAEPMYDNSMTAGIGIRISLN